MLGDDAEQVVVGLGERAGCGESGVGVGEPGFDRRHGLDRLGFEQGFHGTAVGVTADGDVLDTEGGDSELKHGADASEHFAVGRDHVADVTGDEGLSWGGLGEQVGVNA